MGWKHFALASKSTLIVLTAAIIVVVVRVAWMEWSGDFTLPFLRTGRFGELIILLLLGTIVAIVMTKLLQWEFKLETKPRRTRRRK